MLDEFKRKYSNEDTLSVALPYFWDHFDKDGWSLWYSEYRFPEELTQTFMSCNLITGERMALGRTGGLGSGRWDFKGCVSFFPFRNVPAAGQTEEERLRQRHSLWDQQQQLHFWGLGLSRPGACFSGEGGAGEVGEGGFGKCTHVPESEGILETSRNVSMKERSCSQASWALMMGV